ncbi:TetR/AcrR family transcriptional regulator [Thalassobaculum sp.]|uniref:TetR/AcrR family transcriptional regulator n=1 Tax=Thalassobaculum sp. TaxID=2022740 RepID=UPI0032EF4D29
MTTDARAGKAAEILDAAELRMRRGGYDAASFRDLAADVGIKSASVHYHFPQKADLGEAVVERYAERMQAALGRPDDPAESVGQRLSRLCDVYRHAAIDKGLICLCCVLGSQSLELPAPVAEAVGRFFDGLLRWTATALAAPAAGPPSAGPPAAGRSAADIVGSLQGAMVLAIATRRPALFEETRTRLLGGA